MQSTILYIKYIFKDTKIMFKLNLNNQSVSSTCTYNVIKLPLDTDQ